MKRVSEKGGRISKREYPQKKCSKPECGIYFVPTDKRQKYCCDQHRIDYLNDKRNTKEKTERPLREAIKKNKDVLEKIYYSIFYRNKKEVPIHLLEYENYQFEKFNRRLINKKTNNEVLFCFEYGLELINPEEQLFIIHKNNNYEI